MTAIADTTPRATNPLALSRLCCARARRDDGSDREPRSSKKIAAARKWRSMTLEIRSDGIHRNILLAGGRCGIARSGVCK
jgi:hypothetical protein